VLASASDIIRLSLHVIAATIWVGGQLTLAALVPALRGAGAEVPRLAARAFNRVAWPAFAILVATGAWNMAETRDDNHGAWSVTLMVKLAVVLLSGVSAYLHARAKNRVGLAVFGALTGVTALAALVLGIALAG
jgi:putative copper export protein